MAALRVSATPSNLIRCQGPNMATAFISSARPTCPKRGVRSTVISSGASTTSPIEYPVWPKPAPELTDTIVEELTAEALPERLQRYAKVSLSAGMLVLGDQAMKRMMAGLGAQFPHTLAGMLVVVAVSVSAKAAGGTTAETTDKIIDFFGPVRDWVARWMPVFFVPSLISLPLATSSMSGADVARVAQVIIAGWAASLLVATLAIRATRSAAHSALTHKEVRLPCIQTSRTTPAETALRALTVAPADCLLQLICISRQSTEARCHPMANPARLITASSSSACGHSDVQLTMSHCTRCG